MIAAIYIQAIRAGGSTMDRVEKSAADVEMIIQLRLDSTPEWLPSGG